MRPEFLKFMSSIHLLYTFSKSEHIFEDRICFEATILQVQLLQIDTSGVQYMTQKEDGILLHLSFKFCSK